MAESSAEVSLDLTEGQRPHRYRVLTETGRVIDVTSWWGEEARQAALEAARRLDGADARIATMVRLSSAEEEGRLI